MPALAASVLVFAAALGARGDIYRCVGSDGRARFQDQPCPGARSEKLASSEAGDARELRVWLEKLRKSGARAVQPPVAADRLRGLPPRPTLSAPPDERLLALCSQRFLDCANGDAAAMDACIARSARCASGGGGACCPEACVTRYQGLRRAGAPMATAVRDALLDPEQPSCAAR